MKLSPISWVAFILTVVGGLNWGLVGAFNGFDLVVFLLGSIAYAVQIVYILVGLSAIYLIIEALSKKSSAAPQV